MTGRRGRRPLRISRRQNICRGRRPRRPARYTHRLCKTMTPTAPDGAVGAICFYSLRSASMGFSFDAFTAGISPNTTPITMENATATAQAPTLMATGVPITELSI